MIHFNLGSHDGRTIDELTSLVERVSTEVSTESAAFTTSSAAASTRDAIETARRSNPKQGTEAGELSARPINGNALQATSVSNQSDPQIHLPKREFPLPCHGANQAYDAGVESFQNQFGGEEE